MPRATTPPSSHGDARPKRTSACLHCRRQKLKCDGAPDKTCSRCRDDGVECVVRPRANAAIVADDLRWQQSVETRLQTLMREMDEVRAVCRVPSSRAARSPSIKRFQSPSPSGSRSSPRPQPPPPPPAPRLAGATPPPTTGPAAGAASPQPLPAHLLGLRDILRPALSELQSPTPLDVSIEEATLLWEYFYDSLAIFHAFTVATDLATPSPLLFSAVVTASAKRFTGRLVTPVERWEELFQRALVRLLYATVPKNWDDTVGLGIARTWFWKADEITAGLIYGSFVETITPNEPNLRDRRVWDFLEMTTVSHGIVHLPTPIVPEHPPRGVPPRTPSHLLLMALNELFDSLGVVSRALTSPCGLVHAALSVQPPSKTVTFAELVVLRNCRTDLERWCPRWLFKIQNADPSRLPTGSTHAFVSDLITLYYHVALVIIDGYLNQGPQPEMQRCETSARDLLNLAAGRWANSLHLWPKLFIHAALLAAILLPPKDPAVRRTYDLFLPLSHMLQTSGAKLFHRLSERIQANPAALALPVFTPLPDVDFPMAMAYTGSDSFWADLFGLAEAEPLPVPAQWSS